MNDSISLPVKQLLSGKNAGETPVVLRRFPCIKRPMSRSTFSQDTNSLLCNQQLLYGFMHPIC